VVLAPLLLVKEQSNSVYSNEKLTHPSSHLSLVYAYGSLSTAYTSRRTQS